MSAAVVLASASPRRAAILQSLGLLGDVRPPGLEEAWTPDEAPERVARRLAREKIVTVSRQPDELVLSADTLVVLDGRILGKPADEGDAVDMLLRLGGREHMVYTGLALARGDRIEVGVERTAVRFRPLARPECEEYVATGEPLDKAGAYGIQGLGAALVESIDGDYYNVMGLPVQLLLTLFSRFDLRYAFGRLEPA